MSEASGGFDGIAARVQEHERRLNERDADWREFRTWRDQMSTSMAELVPSVRRIERELRQERERRDRLIEEASKQREAEDARNEREQREAERTRWTRFLPWIMAAGSASGLVGALYHFLTAKGGP